MEAREEDLREYVPEWNGNRDKPEADQMSVELAPMTGGELRAAQRAALGRDGKVSLKSAEAAIERIIKAPRFLRSRRGCEKNNVGCSVFLERPQGSRLGMLKVQRPRGSGWG